MAYKIHHLQHNLIFIRWERNPTREDALAFVHDLKTIYTHANGVVYTLADMTGGHISDMGIIARLSVLSQHPNHGGGVTFGGDYRVDAYVGMYERMAHPGDQHGWHPTLDKALIELELRVPGITQHVTEADIRQLCHSNC